VGGPRARFTRAFKVRVVDSLRARAGQDASQSAVAVLSSLLESAKLCGIAPKKATVRLQRWDDGVWRVELL
jgi:hypothetical protein